MNVKIIKNNFGKIDIDKLILGQEDQRLIILPIVINDMPVNIVMFYIYIIMKDIQLMKLPIYFKENHNTIKSQLIRGRKLLKKKLGDDFYE